MSESHELFSSKNQKRIGKFKIKTPKNVWIHEFLCLRSRMYAFECGIDDKIN